MSKIILGGLALFGAVFAISCYVPSLWTQGFDVKGIHFAYAYFVLGGVAYLAYKLKSK